MNRATARRSSVRGQGLVEYALIVGLIAIVVIAVVTVVGKSSKNALCQASSGLGSGGPGTTVIPSANTASDRDNGISNVAAFGANDVWESGLYDDGANGYQPLFEHWDGTSFTVVPSPVVVGFQWSYNLFMDLKGVSSNDLWMSTLTATNGGATVAPLMEHWDGSAWSVVTPASTGTPAEYLTGLYPIASNNVYAVGAAGTSFGAAVPLVEHWDGSAWSIVAGVPGNPGDAMFKITGSSANDIWAVGMDGYGGGAPAPVALHFDGSSWTRSVPPIPPGAAAGGLFSLTSVSATDVWAAGETADGAGNVSGGYLIHWDGTAWTPTTLPNPTSGIAVALAANGPNDVWAVGFSNDPHSYLAHWDGQTWTQVAPPDAFASQFTDAVAFADGKAWIAGATQDSGTSQVVNYQAGAC